MTLTFRKLPIEKCNDMSCFGSDTEFLQFARDAAVAPCNIFSGYGADQSPQFVHNAWPPRALESESSASQGQPPSVGRRSDLVDQTVHLMVEGGSPAEEFGLLCRSRDNSLDWDTRAQNAQLRPHELDVGVMTGQEKVQGQTQDHLKNTLQTGPSFPKTKYSQLLGRQPFANMRIFWNAQESECKRLAGADRQGMAT